MAQPRFAPFVLPETLRVVTAIPELEPLAEVVAGQLAARTGRAVERGEAPARSGDVVLTLGYTAEAVGDGPEALSIEVFEDHVALSGRTPAGVARAAARLLQLLGPVEGGGWSLPPFRLDDAPRFTWRAVRLRGAATAEEGRRLLELLYLGSFNVLVLEAPPSEERAALARTLAPAAAARGVTLLLDPPAGPVPSPLPYVRQAPDPTAGAPAPVLLAPLADGDREGDDLGPLLAAGRRLVDGRSAALRFPAEGPGGPDPARVYGWSPLALLEAVGGEGPSSPASAVIGSEVQLGGASALPRFERALPFLSERSWGAANAPADLAAFAPRARRFEGLLDALEGRGERPSGPPADASDADR